ncbi:MAG: hypothetical protein WA666_08365 [Nitrospirota bacterium]
MQKTTIIHQRTLLYLISVIILLVGLTGALSIYLSAGGPSDSVPMPGLENSKAYMRDVEIYGGTANVLATEFMQWFDGLWHGQQLAYTIACIAIFISFCFAFVAYRLPSDSK